MSGVQPKGSGPWRICIVGLGQQGIDLIERLVADPNRWQVAAVVDQSTAAYARFQWRYHALAVPFFRSLDEALSARPVDAVVIATTAPSHVALARTAIESGHDGVLLVEKPIAQSLGEARELQQFLAARKWTGRLGVGFYRRCADVYAFVREIADEGELGELRRVEFARFGKLSMRGSHYIDLANTFIASRPVAVTSRLDAVSSADHRGVFFDDPPAQLELHYKNGATFALDTRKGSDLYRPGMTFKFEHGEAYVDEPEFSVQITGPDIERSYQSPHEDWHVRHYIWFENTLAALLDDAGCTPCGLEDAITCLEITVAAHQSSRAAGALIDLPLAAEAETEVLRIA